MTSRPASVLANPRSERVKAIRMLAGRSARRKTGKILVEGPQSVREAVRFGEVQDVYLTEYACERFPELLAESETAPGLYSHLVTDEVEQAVSKDAQGIFAVARWAPMDLAAFLETKPSTIVLLSDGRDPGNVGTVIRAADALGADGVVLSEGSVDVTSTKVIRSTAGSLFHLPVIVGVSALTAVHSFARAGLETWATSGLAGRELGDTAIPARVAWVFGNEAHGLERELMNAADVCVRIGLAGHAESLNLAMAATICLYETRTRRGRGNL